tara:strand:+ start:3588 stop:3722 length:135 start_codon:yes stop_codon:yes gene_type:complete
MKGTKGHGPGTGTFGVKGKVENQCPKTPGNFGKPAKAKSGKKGK